MRKYLFLITPLLLLAACAQNPYQASESPDKSMGCKGMMRDGKMMRCPMMENGSMMQDCPMMDKMGMGQVIDKPAKKAVPKKKVPSSSNHIEHHPVPTE